MREPQEQTLAGFCHLCNLVPAWGLIFCGWIWYVMREESRFVVRHARQAMMFHATLLVALLVWMALDLLCRLFAVISPTFGRFLRDINNWAMMMFYAAYLAICLLGCARTMSGQPFRYPLVRIR